MNEIPKIKWNESDIVVRFNLPINLASRLTPNLQLRWKKNSKILLMLLRVTKNIEIQKIGSRTIQSQFVYRIEIFTIAIGPVAQFGIGYLQ